MTKTYKSSDNTQLTEHFNVSEFRCKCGKNHDTVLNPELTEKLEKLRQALNCSKIIINSGYRCVEHDKAVGGSGGGQHVSGNAADIVCYDLKNNRISSKIVSCTAQDIGFGGIANIDSTYTATHVDVRTSNYWKGDEIVTTSHSVTDDFYKYYNIIKNKIIVARGIDVSEYQGVIDWEKVKASGKVDFAILRAGYGREKTQVDRQFERNYSECKRLKIAVGAYWYSYATTADEAKKEASVFLRTLAGKSFEYPIMYDIEESKSLANASELCETFCSELEKNGCYTAVYSFKSAFENNISPNVTSKYDTWLAHVDVEKSDYSGNYGLWQYSWKGRIDGILGDVDLDYAYKDYPEIIRKTGLNGFSEGVPVTKKTAEVSVTVDGKTYSGTLTEK